MSLQSGIFPEALKTAVIKPLLKKSGLDPIVLNNYRPISNLPFLGKVLEKVVYQQLTDFLLLSNSFDVFQSGFRPHHSTETALIKVTNDIRLNTDDGKVSVLILLDLSAAFDTVDHGILLHRLQDWVGISGSALSWLKSHLEHRKYFVEIGSCVSDYMALTCGVPQGLILGPLLFNLYMLPLGQLIRTKEDDLKAAFPTTWASITPRQLHRLTASMPKCIGAVFQVKGSPTKISMHRYEQDFQKSDICVGNI
uniref:Reverse transcriptase domain-containing protein n=1 Tax=Oryzias sinensis TaxID=183150 RepID=A0A8C7YG36_9TELE